MVGVIDELNAWLLIVIRTVFEKSSSFEHETGVM